VGVRIKEANGKSYGEGCLELWKDAMDMLAMMDEDC